VALNSKFHQLRVLRVTRHASKGIHLLLRSLISIRGDKLFDSDLGHLNVVLQLP
jgi:hypothetical protein